MSSNQPDPLERALEAAAGRAPSGEAPTAEVLAAEALAYAQALRATRLAVRAAPSCPRAVLRRAQALFEERGAVRLLRLVFDSWREGAPATRGAGHSRSLRYEDGERALDLRVTRPVSGEVLLQVAAQPAQPGLIAHLAVEGSKREPRISLDESGAGQIRLPRSSHVVTIRIGTKERVLLQALEVPLE